MRIACSGRRLIKLLCPTILGGEKERTITRRYLPDSKIENYLGLTIERIDYPAERLKDIQETVIREMQEVVNDPARKSNLLRDEALEYINDTVMFAAFDGQKLTGFATAHCYNAPKGENFTLLSSTAVKKAYMRMGLMTKLNWNLITLCGESNPVAFLTRNQAVLNAAMMYLRGVVPIGKRPEAYYQDIINFVSREKGWVIDETNIVRHAYSDEASWGPIPIGGLNNGDAYLQAGSLSKLSRFVSRLAVNFYYPLKHFWLSLIRTISRDV